MSLPCKLAGRARATDYYAPAGESLENLLLMRLIDEQYPARPLDPTFRTPQGIFRKNMPPRGVPGVAAVVGADHEQ